MMDEGTGPPVIVIPGIQGRWEWMRPALRALVPTLPDDLVSLAGDSGGRCQPAQAARIRESRPAAGRHLRSHRASECGALRCVVRRLHRVAIRRHATGTGQRAGAGFGSGARLGAVVQAAAIPGEAAPERADIRPERAGAALGGNSQRAAVLGGSRPLRAGHGAPRPHRAAGAVTRRSANRRSAGG